MKMLTRTEYTLSVPDDDSADGFIVTERWKCHDEEQTECISRSILVGEHGALEWFTNTVLGYTINTDKELVMKAWKEFIEKACLEGCT